jgi:quinol-cytochrome oxidoreductase complex cytochrome b subunit
LRSSIEPIAEASVKRIHRLIHAGRERVGWEHGIGPFLFKKLPSRTGWYATLGSLLVVLFITMFISGVFLAMYYNPSPDKAYQAVDYIMKDVPAGWLLRGIHHWGASAMVIVVFLHMLTSFFSGTYRSPREFTWVSGVVLLLITLGLGFTGYLLPWDLKSYWATVVSTNIPKDIPLIGHSLSHLMLGGDTVSGATLTRFYAVHAMLLPALFVVLTGIHIYLVRVHGIAEETEDAEPATTAAAPMTTNGDAEPLYRFYPEHLWRASVVFAAVFIVLIALSIFVNIPREAVAGTLVDSYLPRPEWYYMWLFQLLTYFPGKWEAVGSLMIPFVGVILLFTLPFFNRPKRLGTVNRPIPMAVGVMIIVGMIYLTFMGFAGAKSYGQTFAIPDRTLTADEARGLYLYANRECAYCHQIEGQGGHRVGPDLSNEIAKRHDKDYLVRYIRNPQAVNSTSIMPKYDLPEADLNALADFILALDFHKYSLKTVTRAEALGQTEQPLAGLRSK